MKNILLCGAKLERNLGIPSLLHGAEEALAELYGDDVNIVYYQPTTPDAVVVSDMRSTVKTVPYVGPRRLLVDALFAKFGRMPKDKKRRELFTDVKNADAVLNIYGIYFCDNLGAPVSGFMRAERNAIGEFSLNYIAKRFFHKRSLKSMASYGPIKHDAIKKEARIAYRRIFDIMLSRENESRRVLLEATDGKCDTRVFPDLANLMKYDAPKPDMKRPIGISVSHQILRQWDSGEGYMECINALIRHILSTTDRDILLIPNEVMEKNPYNDANVAADIMKKFKGETRISVPDMINTTSTQQKSLIASCEVLVASRYHSCVAALSSGVPTLVIGWHYKYDELLKLYGQDGLILSKDTCTSKQLTDAFDAIYEKRDAVRSDIERHIGEVRASVMEAMRLLFPDAKK